jgi:pyrimidine-nucleoside phosphorylase
MDAVSLIRKKREGEMLSEEEIVFLVEGYVKGEIPDYQISSLLMVVFFRGLSFEETGYLTRAMIDSGEVIDLSSVDGPLIDKHSTGGVGDKVSLILAPLAAACGIKVPMMSGRSLGHTGGTLDKMESIPGYRTDIPTEDFLRCLEEVGFSMIGQSERVVPADRKMYALRNVTATVDSVPLITASILSKKFAEGAQGLVLDVKTGSGAFMKTEQEAEILSRSLYETGTSLGRKVSALITNMNQPLGNNVGNFLEVREAVDCLKGNGPEDLMGLTLKLTERMLIMGGICSSREEAESLCSERIRDGAALEKFLANVRFQGGDVDVIHRPEIGPRASLVKPLHTREEGVVEVLDAYRVGVAATRLGAGRTRKEDEVLPAVGVELKKKRGDRVRQGDVLCLIHAETQRRLEEATQVVASAYRIGSDEPPSQALVLSEIGG